MNKLENCRLMLIARGMDNDAITASELESVYQEFKDTVDETMFGQNGYYRIAMTLEDAASVLLASGLKKSPVPSI